MHPMDHQSQPPQPVRMHSVAMDNREKVTITAVTDIDSFNENEIILNTDLGYITLVGEDLHITRLNLDDGHLFVEGHIQSLDYADHEQLRSQKGHGGIVRRVFGS